MISQIIVHPQNSLALYRTALFPLIILVFIFAPLIFPLKREKKNNRNTLDHKAVRFRIFVKLHKFSLASRFNVWRTENRIESFQYPSERIFSIKIHKKSTRFWLKTTPYQCYCSRNLNHPRKTKTTIDCSSYILSYSKN